MYKKEINSICVSDDRIKIDKFDFQANENKNAMKMSFNGTLSLFS
jgi:hypothetical protein